MVSIACFFDGCELMVDKEDRHVAMFNSVATRRMIRSAYCGTLIVVAGSNLRRK